MDNVPINEIRERKFSTKKTLMILDIIIPDVINNNQSIRG